MMMEGSGEIEGNNGKKKEEEEEAWKFQRTSSAERKGFKESKTNKK